MRRKDRELTANSGRFVGLCHGMPPGGHVAHVSGAHACEKQQQGAAQGGACIFTSRLEMDDQAPPPPFPSPFPMYDTCQDACESRHVTQTVAPHVRSKGTEDDAGWPQCRCTLNNWTRVVALREACASRWPQTSLRLQAAAHRGRGWTPGAEQLSGLLSCPSGAKMLTRRFVTCTTA